MPGLAGCCAVMPGRDSPGHDRRRKSSQDDQMARVGWGGGGVGLSLDPSRVDIYGREGEGIMVCVCVCGGG